MIFKFRGFEDVKIGGSRKKNGRGKGSWKICADTENGLVEILFQMFQITFMTMIGDSTGLRSLPV